MFRNYFRIAWRNILRHKGYAAINIIGLALGIAACMLILQYVSFELSYENFHQQKDRIYRVRQDRFDNGKLSTQWASGAYAVGNSFKDAIPEIEDYVKLIDNGKVTTDVDNQPVDIDKVYFATNSFFSVFTYNMLSGDKQNALKEPSTAVMSASTAKRIFGTTDILGKKIQLNRNSNYTITGVFDDAPANTQLRPDMLLSYSSFLKLVGPNFNPEAAWLADGCLTYLLLKKGADPKKVEAKFIPVVDKFTAEDMKKYNAAVTYHLQPLKLIHLYSHFIGEPGETGDGNTVYLLMGIALFIVVIAWVNYVNLATARAINRAREVGIRKAVGSQRFQLVIQFLSEAGVLNFIALIIAFAMVLLAIPGFNNLTGQHLSFSLLGQPQFWLGLVSLFLIGVFFSGLYPAFVLSGFRPIEVLKGKLGTSGKGSMLRKSLVVFQFTASLFLLIGTVIVFRQMQYMRNQQLGLNIEQTLVVKPGSVGLDSTFVQRTEAFKNDLMRTPYIKGVTKSTTVPGQPVPWNAGAIKLVGADETTQKQYRVIGVDYDYMRTYAPKLIAGRSFDKSFGSDEQSVVYNMKGFEQLGLAKPEDAIGKKIDFWGEQYTIIGITENFHQQSLREAYEPLIFRLTEDANGYLSIQTSGNHSRETIELAREKWKAYFPGNTFEYFFLDDHFGEQYKADQRFGTVFSIFTTLAILVACLGLFGLASFTTLQRTKEISVRKVLGASVFSILQLLYREFIILLLIAFCIAAPIAWISGARWLEGYAFRTDISLAYIIIPFFIIVFIALVAVSFQSVKAALMNPVKSLRME
jgi:putative ABC transport system permease protein